MLDKDSNLIESSMAEEKKDSSKSKSDKRYKISPYYLVRDRTTVGRKRKYSNGQDLLNDALAYFKNVDDNPRYEIKVFGSGMKFEVPMQLPYTMSGLYLALEIDQKMFERYEIADEPRDDGSEITEDDISLAHAAGTIRNIIRTQKIEGASIGIFQHQIVALELGLAKKSEATVINHDSATMSPDEVKAYNKQIEEDY